MHISLHDKNARSLQQSIQYRKSYEKCISKVYEGTKTIEEQTTLISFVAHDKDDGKVLTQKLNICSFAEKDFLYPMVYA